MLSIYTREPLTKEDIARDVANIFAKFDCEWKANISTCAGLISIKLSAKRKNTEKDYELGSMEISEFEEKRLDIYRNITRWVNFYFIREHNIWG